MTSAPREAPGARLLDLWARCRRMPFGAGLFGLLLGRIVPYSGTIRARVHELAPGRARITLGDRRGVRNHLGSIHAVALANLGELTSGLAMTAALPPGTRAIVLSLTTEYLKKARGTIAAASDVTLPPIEGDTEHLVTAELRDASNDVVARTTVRWRIGPA